MKIALYKGTSHLSHAIEHITRGVYSHAALILPDGSVIEAMQGSGVRHIPELVKDAPFDIFEVQTTPEQEKAIIEFARAQVGKPYDYDAITGFFTYRDKSDDEVAWFCSELVFAAFAKAGINLLQRVKAWAVHPVMLSYSPLLVPCSYSGWNIQHDGNTTVANLVQ